ncbi:MAG: 3-hydroxyacyl-CoA dehydrogenase family protein [Thermodesulfobacteriota bacterium]|nr:3-hydroxyacyl-CoA dehydrogenase family protein [Thermodesulfobacteriota bacterium]
MDAKDVKKVGIVGCGTMGPTIAVAVSLKYETVVKEVSEELAKKGLAKIQKFYPGLVKRQKITEDEAKKAVDGLNMVSDFEPLSECQVIIDATPDDLEIKSEVFNKLNEICPWNTVFTTTSSLLSITALATASGRPDKFIGTHYCIPAHLMALVEIARPVQTSEETYAFMVEFLKSLGKTPVSTKDWPGFLVNYILFPYLVAALKAHQGGLGTPEEIDTAAKLGLGFPLGPFQLMDMSGLDAVLSALEILQGQLNDDAYAPPPVLRKMVEAGYLGQKTGRGFYEY